MEGAIPPSATLSAWDPQVSLVGRLCCPKGGRLPLNMTMVPMNEQLRLSPEPASRHGVGCYD